LDAAATAQYIRSLIDAPEDIPAPIQHQVSMLCELAAAIR
jgi:hypothetical protein